MTKSNYTSKVLKAARQDAIHCIDTRGNPGDYFDQASKEFFDVPIGWFFCHYREAFNRAWRDYKQYGYVYKRYGITVDTYTKRRYNSRKR